jgi:BCCT family betaine/carnitine transporter
MVPTLVTIAWMTAFGGNALHQIQNGIGTLAEKGLGEVSLAMFQMLENLPLSSVTSFLGIVLVLVFFVEMDKLRTAPVWQTPDRGCSAFQSAGF